MGRTPEPKLASRREALKGMGVLAALGLFTHARLGKVDSHVDVATGDGTRYLRPPGAVAEADFASRCVRCHKCAEDCSNRCIRLVGAEGPAEARGTPYIVPREKGCTLCMRCNQGCPSGALEPVDPDGERIWEQVAMGKAAIDTNICHSHNGYVCGVCIRACPLQGLALAADLWEVPVLDPEYCVGCGLCEQACFHMPQAIRVTAA